MNTMSQNGFKVVTTDSDITINGKTYPIPDWVKEGGKKGISVSMNNTDITINGFPFDQKSGEFSRSKKSKRSKDPWWKRFLNLFEF